jgi:hypothetical protein
VVPDEPEEFPISRVDEKFKKARLRAHVAEQRATCVQILGPA